MTRRHTNTVIGATHTMLSKDGTTISYLSIGSGPSVLVIPGVLSMASDYAAFARTLAEHCTVHTIERRGRGESGPQGVDYSIVKECEDVLKPLIKNTIILATLPSRMEEGKVGE
jgi:pimeloyl-ACP methyl ester carboxylesterase